VAPASVTKVPTLGKAGAASTGNQTVAWSRQRHGRLQGLSLVSMSGSQPPARQIIPIEKPRRASVRKADLEAGFGTASCRMMRIQSVIAAL